MLNDSAAWNRTTLAIFINNYIDNLHTPETIQPVASSYRDPSGFVFERNKILYRQVNKIFKEEFDHFLSSSCYDHLTKKRLLIAHEEVNENILNSDRWYKTLLPARVPFLSYPYEWCFNMLKDAALLTLQILKECLPFGIILKDATPYNVQWVNGRLIFIDTLSFEKYNSTRPWIAYRQFCEIFLSPLLLMHYTGQPLQSLLLAFPDGLPLPVSKSLLPWRSRLSLLTYLHVHLHERLSSKSAGKEPVNKNDFSEKKLRRLVDSLESLIQSLHLPGKPSVWSGYYAEADQRNDYLEQKKFLIRSWIKELPEAKMAIDLGANTGDFSNILAAQKLAVIATDFDHVALNNFYRNIVNAGEKNILPLLVDVANPSPAVGVNNGERLSFISRVDADLCLALALIHHLSIGKNIPFDKIAAFLHTITSYLVVEFVPKQDQKVQYMLRQKKDIYSDYTEEHFERNFARYFSIQKKQEIGNSGRILYQMKKAGK